MKLYRLYIGRRTKDTKTLVETDKVVAFVSQWFDGATILEGTGLWKGKTEETIVVEVSEPDADTGSIRAFVERAKNRFRQECILVVTLDCGAEFA